MRYLLLVPILLSGCVTTQVTSYTDNAYKGHRVQKILVVSTNNNFTRKLESKVIQKISKTQTPAISSVTYFPPTRKYTQQELSNTLATNGIDSMLVLTYGGANRQAQVLGYMHNYNASAYAYGNTANVYGTGYSSPIVGYSAQSKVYAKLVDLRTKRTIWVGQFDTRAGGALFTNAEAMTANISSKIVSDLKTKGHLLATSK